MVLAWLTFGVGIAQLVFWTLFATGRWVGKQEQRTNSDNDHATPQPANLSVLAQHEEEIKRCRDRLHHLEGFEQQIYGRLEDRHPTRREYQRDQEEFKRVRDLVETISRRENHH